jgi:hypothetical protein
LGFNLQKYQMEKKLKWKYYSYVNIIDLEVKLQKFISIK